MRLVVAAVGALKDGPERALVARYEDRVGKLARSLGFGPVQMVEVPEGRARSSESRQREEAERLDTAAPARPRVVLDERGRPLSSEGFATWLGARRDAGVACVSFLLGGADGLARDLVRSGDLMLSLGPMTWPHQLARALLYEQLYRAATILAGHPYHRA